MKLVVGLGNPGRKYEKTRHNVGFDVLDVVARKFSALTPSAKFEGRLTEVTIGGIKTLLLWPQTFMNLSGTSLGKAKEFYRIPDEDLLVVCDDFNLPLERLRFRAGGSSGGQKGLADIVRRLGNEEFSRLRIGVGPVPTGWDAADFVLGKFSKDEGPRIEMAIDRAAEAVADWVTSGTAVCMNRYNSSPA
jgi:peptidyl-tRNA hydrolase, PTH1 family